MTALKNKDVNMLSPTVVTIGTFDGVHLGHQKILKQLIHVAKTKGLTPIVLSFFPHPRMVLKSQTPVKLLNTIEEREAMLSSFGVEHIVIKKFTEEFASLSAEDYVNTILVNQLKAKHIIIGYDHRFGRNRSADINALKQFGEELAFEVQEITVQDVEDVAVSSTKIRTALDNGDIQTANQYLGYNYYLSGTVVKGKSNGKLMDFPTANISIPEAYKLIPKQGVYVVKVELENKTYFGMMNIGTNPTVSGDIETIEVHIFDFNQTIYGKSLRVELLKRLRDEQKFESLDLLKKQLQNDKQNALQFIKTV